MVKTDFPRDGDFWPPTDYMDRSPLDTRERKELKKSTSKNLNDLNQELWGDFKKVTVLWTIKTFDKGFGLRIRDDNGDKIGTAYKWEQVRIFGRKKGVMDSEGKIRNFLKVGVYNNRGKIDEKRSGWVAEDFVEVDQEHINTLIQNLETRIDRQEKPEPVKPEEKKPEPVKPEEKKPEPVKPEEKKPEPVTPTTETPEKASEGTSSIDTIQNRDTIGEISRNINITPEKNTEAMKPSAWFPLFITDPLAIPNIDTLTPKTETEKDSPSTPVVIPEVKNAETAKTEVKHEEKKPEPPKPEEKKTEVNPEPVKPEIHKPIPEAKQSEPIITETKELEPMQPEPIRQEVQKPQPEPEKDVIRNSLGTVLEERTVNMLNKMSSNAKIAYQRMVWRARDLQCNFIIADKPYGMIYIFNQLGQWVTRFPALYGRKEGDDIPLDAQGKLPDQLTENEEISPAGIFVLSEIYYNPHNKTDLLDIGEDYDEDGYADSENGTALHPLFLEKPWQNRPERLKSKTPEDNKISKGCINVSEEAFERWIRPCFADGGLIATTPDNQENLDIYIPPYTSDVKNMIAETSN